jgi:cyclopropane fatty-acyl-phospholipid synthase-like methyltransferase
VLNSIVAKYGIQSVIEFGCGDGNQLRLAKYPKYIGFDVSANAIAMCRKLFTDNSALSFALMQDYGGESADMAISLDVIYHLTEDQVFERYMRTIFAAAKRYVVIYSSNTDDNQSNEEPHIRHRNFTKWTERNMPTWRLVTVIPNKYPYKGNYREGSFADFYIYCTA